MPYYPHHSKNRWPVTDGITKQCRRCLETKPVADFWINRSNHDGLQTFCKVCGKRDNYTYRTTEHGMIRVISGRHKHALKKFRLTQAGYDALLLAQDGLCAICRMPETMTNRAATTIGPRRLAVDHCHKTGKIRGLLCCGCNQAIGRFKDNPATLRAAIAYIKASLTDPDDRDREPPLPLFGDLM